MNIYNFLADVMVAVHLGYVAFVVFGMLLILLGIARSWRWVRNFWFRTVHFLMIAVVVAESLGGIVCPLTVWEHDLRMADARANGDVVSETEATEPPESFVGRWVHRLMFFTAPPWVFTLCYSLFGAAVLATLILAPPRWPWVKTKT
jgi:hypothetical protein